jgi:hypothetical protein
MIISLNQSDLEKVKESLSEIKDRLVEEYLENFGITENEELACSDYKTYNAEVWNDESIEDAKQYAKEAIKEALIQITN